MATSHSCALSPFARKREEAGSHQAEGGKESEPAKDDHEASREIWPESALSIKHLHSVFQREKKGLGIDVNEVNGQNAVGVHEPGWDLKFNG